MSATPVQIQKTLNEAAFALETVAHLRGFEAELLPIAEKLRQHASFFVPTASTVMPEDAEKISGVPAGILASAAMLLNTSPGNPGFLLAMQRANREMRFEGATNVGDYVDGYLKSMIYHQRRLDDAVIIKEDPKLASKRARDLGL